MTSLQFWNEGSATIIPMLNGFFCEVQGRPFGGASLFIFFFCRLFCPFFKTECVLPRSTWHCISPFFSFETVLCNNSYFTSLSFFFFFLSTCSNLGVEVKQVSHCLLDPSLSTLLAGKSKGEIEEGGGLSSSRKLFSRQYFHMYCHIKISSRTYMQRLKSRYLQFAAVIDVVACETSLVAQPVFQRSCTPARTLS